MRNSDLMMCDWTQLPDVILPDEEIQAWKNYRLQLRNITNEVTDPMPYVSIPKPNWLWPCPPGQIPIMKPSDPIIDSNIDSISSMTTATSNIDITNFSNI
jgi:hypothetical protein